jgi:hypothetical protein
MILDNSPQYTRDVLSNEGKLKNLINYSARQSIDKKSSA